MDAMRTVSCAGDNTSLSSSAILPAFERIAQARRLLSSPGVLTAIAKMIVFGDAGTRVRTIGGWTPGVRALVGSHVLHCGCLAGVYQTYSGEIARIVDVASDDCRVGHAANHVLDRAAEGELRSSSEPAAG